MTRKIIFRILCILSIFLILGMLVSLGIDYYRYSTTLNSAPFYVWALVRWLEFGVPAQILFIIAWLLERKDKK